jgi:predicted hydrocarbon binding protein
MATEAPTRTKDAGFWRDFPSMTDYFSDGINTLQSYLGIGSKEAMFELGKFFGERAANKIDAPTTKDMLHELENVWQKYDIGTLDIADEDPLVLVVSDCRICGKLSGTGDMYECAFHEGFFQGALSAKMKKKVSFHQETNYEGEAGTWCRVMVSDTKV